MPSSLRRALPTLDGARGARGVEKAQRAPL
jgi:hypothetical protein